MTRAQFADVVGTDEKWIENTTRALGERLEYNDEEARRLRLVFLLARDFSMSVARAAALSNEMLGHPATTRDLRVSVGADSPLQLSFDLARFTSGYIAALSAARELGGARQAGRPRARVAESTPAGYYAALDAASRFGLDLSLLRANAALTPAERLVRLDENRAFLRDLRMVRRS